jgi:hypothetical protein
MDATIFDVAVVVSGAHSESTKGIWNQQEPDDSGRAHMPVGASVGG